MGTINAFDAASIIFAHEMLVDEFRKVLSDEESEFRHWATKIKDPNAFYALAAALKHFHGSENLAAISIIETLKDVASSMQYYEHRIEQFKEVLQFYGSSANWEITHDPDHGTASTSRVALDGGEMARKIIERL